MNDIPRRCQVPEWSEGERAIADAVRIVEGMGANMHLTRAVVLLQDARNAVADFVDQVPEPAATPRVPAGTRLSGDDALPFPRTCSRGCNYVVTGRHAYHCAAYPPLCS